MGANVRELVEIGDVVGSAGHQSSGNWHEVETLL
jgi:hypothetical protein